MSGTYDSVEGRVRYAHALRTHALLIAGITLAALLAALLVTVTATKRYTANADLQIQPDVAAVGNDPFQGFNVFRQPADGTSPAVAAARVFSAPRYHDLLRQRLGRKGSGVSVSVTPLSQADIVNVAASAPEPALAADAANRYTAMLIADRKALFQQQLHQRLRELWLQMRAIPVSQRATSATYTTFATTFGELRTWLDGPDPTVQLLTSATAPTAAAWPRPKLTLIVALVVGLLLGLAAAVGLEVLNPRVTREDELALSHRLPVLARMPRLKAREVRNYFLGHGTLPRGAWKAYRTLRAMLVTAGPDGRGYPPSILVTSSCPGDGKTLTAVNLAIALSASGLRVTLVDADVPRPMVGTMFKVAGHRAGFVHLLRDPEGASIETVDASLHPRLKLLLSSPEQMTDLRLFDADRIRRVVERLLTESDVVVIDSPPPTEVAEALALADAADAVLLCVRVGHTRRDRLHELRDLLARRGVSPLGFFLTSRRRPKAGEPAYDGYPVDLPAIPGDYLFSSDSTVTQLPTAKTS